MTGTTVPRNLHGGRLMTEVAGMWLWFCTAVNEAPVIVCAALVLHSVKALTRSY